MKIASRLKFNTLLFAGVVLVLSLLFAAVFSMQRRAFERSLVAEELVGWSYDLNSLSNRYLRYPEERPKEQWKIAYDALERELSRQPLREPGRGVIVKRMRQNLSDMQVLFGNLVAVNERKDATHSMPAADSMLERQRIQMADLIIRRSRDLSLGASRLSALSNNEIAAINRSILFFTPVVALLLTGLTAWTSARIRRSITDPVNRLRSGAAMIGSGNLDYKTGIRTGDEIGELSGAFDAMTTSLRAITVSRDELAREITVREQAEKALRESRRMLQEIIDGSPSIISLKDLQGRFLTINKPLEKMLNISREDIKGKTDYDIFPGDRADYYREHDRQVIENGQTLQAEEALMSTEGKQRIFLTNKFPLFDSAGEPYAVCGISLDITDRKRNEEEREQLVVKLRELAIESDRNRAQLEAVLEAMSEGVAIFDMKGRLVFTNEAEAGIIGYPDTETLARDLDYFTAIYELKEIDGRPVAPGDWPVARVLKGESVENRELWGRRKDTGQEWFFSFSAEPVRDDQGRQILALVITRDITEGKRNYEEFKRISRQNELILEYAGEGICGMDQEGRVTFINTTGAHMLGYKRNELLGLKGHSVWHYQKPDGSPFSEEECPLHSTYREEKSGYGEELFWKRDRTSFPVEFTSRPLYEEGTPTGSVVIYRDITERKQAEDNLKRLLEELERSNRELEQFAYVASHDLQEPLRMVASYVQLFERKYKGHLDEKADRYIFYAVDGVVRMQKLIDGLLAYSRVARGAELRRVDMNKIFSLAVMNLTILIRENRAVVTADKLPEVTGDEVQLSQVFQNLIGNALKFRKPDKAPEVRVSVKPAAESREWIFGVSDNGIGIDPQYGEKIFLIFQRLHSREAYPGTGIGLSLTKRIIERHGGRIWVESEPGEGSTFYFALPKRKK